MGPEHNLPQKKISGWSNTNFSHSSVASPETVEEVLSVILEAKRRGRKILARGGGQSYGDESLNDGQVSVDMSGMKKILAWDANKGLLQVQVGATYEDVLSRCLKDGWVLAVVPGTRHVSMGGALANNVHGKNSYLKGNFGEWVREFKIVLASGELRTCSRETDSDLFSAVISGAGLLGIVTEITLQLMPIPSPYLSIKKSTAPSLEKLMNDLDNAAEEGDYAIAQVDGFPETAGMGRGTIHAANFSHTDFKPGETEDMRVVPQKMFGILPKKIIPAIGKYVLNDFTMEWVSRLKYYLEKNTAPKEPHQQDFFQFTFFLDKVPGWKEVFRHGFYEYEPLLPRKVARAVIPQLIALAHKYKMLPYLSAIKVHRKDDFLLSYSMDGYSFAMDIPRRPKEKERQDELFRKMNEVVIKAGGIIYLAKDAHLTASEFRQMYKNVDRFMALKKKYDPDELFQSDMYRRIFKKQA